MFALLQERIQPQEVLKLVLAVILTGAAAYMGTSHFVSPDIEDLTRKQRDMTQRLNFNNLQLSQLDGFLSPAKLSQQISTAKEEIERRGLSLDEEVSKNGNPPSVSLSEREAEIRDGKINEVIEKSGIFIQKSLPGKNGTMRTRKVEGEAVFNSVVRALIGLKTLEVKVTKVELTRIPDTKILKITLDLAL